jgi:hypothetical protein
LRQLSMITKGEESITVTSLQVMKQHYPLFGIVILCLSLWTAFDPWKWEWKVIATDKNGIPTESFGRCYCDNYLFYVLPQLIIIAIMNGITLYKVQ